jgi:hypothetical protein
MASLGGQVHPGGKCERGFASLRAFRRDVAFFRFFGFARPVGRGRLERAAVVTRAAPAGGVVGASLQLIRTTSAPSHGPRNIPSW